MEVLIDVCFQNAASCPYVSSLVTVGDHPTGVTNELLIPAGVSSPVNVIVINLQVLYVQKNEFKVLREQLNSPQVYSDAC